MQIAAFEMNSFLHFFTNQKAYLIYILDAESKKHSIVVPIVVNLKSNSNFDRLKTFKRVSSLKREEKKVTRKKYRTDLRREREREKKSAWIKQDESIA